MIIEDGKATFEMSDFIGTLERAKYAVLSRGSQHGSLLKEEGGPVCGLGAIALGAGLLEEHILGRGSLPSPLTPNPDGGGDWIECHLAHWVASLVENLLDTSIPDENDSITDDAQRDRFLVARLKAAIRNLKEFEAKQDDDCNWSLDAEFTLVCEKPNGEVESFPIPTAEEIEREFVNSI